MVPTLTPMPKKGVGPSLKARAVAYLARREHSRHELRLKLASWTDDQDAIELVLDELQAQNWQSDERYAQSYVQRTAGRHGAQRIIQTLRQQGVQDAELDALQQELRQSEPERALEVWRHKFGHKPADARQYAKQYRFMLGRGFAAETIANILKSAGLSQE